MKLSAPGRIVQDSHISRDHSGVLNRRAIVAELRWAQFTGLVETGKTLGALFGSDSTVRICKGSP